MTLIWLETCSSKRPSLSRPRVWTNLTPASLQPRCHLSLQGVILKVAVYTLGSKFNFANEQTCDNHLKRGQVYIFFWDTMLEKSIIHHLRQCVAVVDRQLLEYTIGLQIKYKSQRNEENKNKQTNKQQETTTTTKSSISNTTVSGWHCGVWHPSSSIYC